MGTDDSLWWILWFCLRMVETTGYHFKRTAVYSISLSTLFPQAGESLAHSVIALDGQPKKTYI
jgi:hypothetical protein